MIEEEQIPDSLFKYRGFDEKMYYKDLLESNTLFFSSPQMFNDPFDCRVYPNYETGTDKEIFQKFKFYTKEFNPGLNELQINKIAEKDFRRNVNSIRNPGLLKIRAEKALNKFGVCSLTESNSNLLMWSHYADCHKGFCIEFNAKVLSQICENYLRINELIMLYKVRYEKSYPLINPYVENFDHADFVIWLITKSLDWKYEQEWRLIYRGHSNETLKFPDEILKAIYFGVNCSDEKIHECKKILNRRKAKPKFYKAYLAQREFKILFKTI